MTQNIFTKMLKDKRNDMAMAMLMKKRMFLRRLGEMGE
jgi:hypothetical protein